MPFNMRTEGILFVKDLCRQGLAYSGTFKVSVEQVNKLITFKLKKTFAIYNYMCMSIKTTSGYLPNIHTCPFDISFHLE